MGEKTGFRRAVGILISNLSKNMGDIKLYGMIGYTVIGNSGNPGINNITPYSLGADYKMTEKFHLVGEIGSYIHPDKLYYANPSSMLVGATYKLSDSLIIDGGYRFNLNPSYQFKSTTFGMSITFYNIS